MLRHVHDFIAPLIYKQFFKYTNTYSVTPAS